MRNVTGVAATNVITTKTDQASPVPVNHGLRVGNRVFFRGLAGGAGLTNGTTYYVISVPSDSTFTVSATRGGAVLDFTTDITAGRVFRQTTAALRQRRTWG